MPPRATRSAKPDRIEALVGAAAAPCWRPTTGGAETGPADECAAAGPCVPAEPAHRRRRSHRSVCLTVKRVGDKRRRVRLELAQSGIRLGW